jgi:glycogen synthase
MRLLFLTNRYPPHMTGGYEVVTQLVADGLRERGHEVDILTSVYGVKRKLVEGNVYRLLHQTWDSSQPHRLAWWEIADLLEARRLIRRRRPDCIWIWGGLGLFPSLLKEIARLEIPLVYDIHDIWLSGTLKFAREWAAFWQTSGSGLLNQVMKPWVRNSLALFHPSAFKRVEAGDLKLENAVFVSHAEEELNRSHGFVFRHHTVIHNGVDTRKFYPKKKRSSDEKLKALFVGRLVESKGVHIALQAISDLVDRGRAQIRLTIAGVVAPPFEYYDSLKKFIAEHQLEPHVGFIDPVGNEAMPDIYQDHDVLVLPSHKEGFSMVILEAMACGLVVVGTTVGGNAEVLRDGENSLTFPVDDAEALANQLGRLMEDEALGKRLSDSGKSLVQETFTLQHMVQERETFLLGRIKGPLA